MLSQIRKRIVGLRVRLDASRRTADEMLDQYGDDVWNEFQKLESSAWKRSAFQEFVYWKLTHEFAREKAKKFGQKAS
jgi:hypothetical protein